MTNILCPREDFARFGEASISLGEEEERLQILFEPRNHRFIEENPNLVEAFAEHLQSINEAALKKQIEFVPGLSTIRLHDHAGGTELLAPGLLNYELASKYAASINLPIAAIVTGQLFPVPSILIKLTAAESRALANALASGGGGATVTTIVLILTGMGIPAAIAGALALVLIADALIIDAMIKLSPIGAIGLKVTTVPTFGVWPFPRF